MSLTLVYTNEEAPQSFTKSLFLAGPSLRPNQTGISWRKEAIEFLEKHGYDGVVFVPENRNSGIYAPFDYDAQVEWEEKYLKIADCILFWVPRDITFDEDNNLKLPAFTTNVEFGTWMNSGKVVFGAPSDADKNTYLLYYTKKLNIPTSFTLEETIANAISKIGNGTERIDGERFVPLMIWNLESFQDWYKSHQSVGNVLQYADLLYSFRPQNKFFVFLWILKVHVWIKEENRVKENEFVLSRTDISSVVLMKKNSSLNDAEVVLVKEFRSPARTIDGFIYELPGGSSKKNQDPIAVAMEEIHEETGVSFDRNRFKLINTRQLAGTLSAHVSTLYSIELTEDELQSFKEQKGQVHGVEEDSERTFVEVYTIKELLENALVDWSTLGMILSAYNQ